MCYVTVQLLIVCLHWCLVCVSGSVCVYVCGLCVCVCSVCVCVFMLCVFVARLSVSVSVLCVCAFLVLCNTFLLEFCVAAQSLCLSVPLFPEKSCLSVLSPVRRAACVRSSVCLSAFVLCLFVRVRPRLCFMLCACVFLPPCNTNFCKF